ncbi:hypothetical protein [Streptomyces sp. SID3343]|uniref:hypothetical protein n=1 Tax=Streptomyces sp. SID3343 TaxID=2690260 RepID=UPI0013684E38|nr:hypothetical protein [Streptomyces sp. SID3343]MYW01122.1 hypothetical protein [Streptomyces sp. SID3343]
MENPVWGALPAGAQDRIDALLAKKHHVQAIKAIRDASPQPVPGIHECMDLVTERCAALGLLRVPRVPTAPLNLDALTAKVRGLPRRPAAIEAVWDGDTEGWFVRLLAVMTAPNAEHDLALVQYGGDLRLFNGEVPPWPEAEDASTVGRALAERFGVPFHFGSPEAPTDTSLRWWDSL